MGKRRMLLLAAVMCSVGVGVHAADNRYADTVKVDSTKKETGKKIKPYKDVITKDAVTQSGLFKVHQVDQRWFFEIPTRLLNLDVAVITRMISGSAKTGPAGEQVGEAMIRFEKGPGNRLFFTRPFYLLRADETENDGIAQALENSNKSAIYASFDVKAYGADSASVIDVTDYVNSDNRVFGFTLMVQGGMRTKQSGYANDKSFIVSARAYPNNVELRTVKTYGGEIPVTYELNSSIVVMPQEKMQARNWDRRTGYFATGHYLFKSDEPVKSNWMIKRWKLEPKENEIGLYQSGTLVEPKKPIVFYIDPATPKKWIPYLMQGVADWNQAFAKAGFKNAISAVPAPTGDSTWNIEDARHSVIMYKASEVPNASGPNISDPRTGEIIESHIDWYHNVQQVLRDWYFIQASPNDIAAQTPSFDDSLMGRLIRFVCAHEVGHTLGLRHNFSASASVPTDSLRSKNYLDKNGLCPSIMDYARFNYVAQPEDKLSREELMPHIGVYDEWAIEYGYRWFPTFESREKENAFLSDWVTRKTKDDRRLWYTYYDPSSVTNLDPRRRAEDLGDDPMKAGAYGIKNLQRIVPKLENWTQKNDVDYDEMKTLYNGVVGQYFRYCENVSAVVGGMSWMPKYREQPGAPIEYPSRAQQRAAVSFLNKELFATPSWLLDEKLFSLVATDPSYADFYGLTNLINTIQRTILARVVSHTTANGLMVQETASKDAYHFDELLSDMESGIFSELRDAGSVSIYRRNLQKLYVEKLIEMTAGFFATRNYWDKAAYPLVTVTDVYPVVKDHMKQLAARMNAVNPKDRLTQLHVREMKERINNALKDFPNSWMNLENKRQPTVASGLNLSQDLIQYSNFEGCWKDGKEILPRF